MATPEDFNRVGEDLERMLILRTSPLAVKMLASEADIPAGAIRPKRDRGYHLAQCQAFAMSRRQRETVAMLREDNWCWAPLIAYGMAPRPDDPALAEHTAFPCLERDKYIGVVSAPLKKAGFSPDLAIIYSNTAQMRTLLLAIEFGQRDRVGYHFFPPACAFLVVPVLETGGYMVALPDPGDYERAMAAEDEIILSVPADKLAGLAAGLRRLEERKLGYATFSMEMRPDFPRPEFYKKLFREWGLDTQE